MSNDTMPDTIAPPAGVPLADVLTLRIPEDKWSTVEDPTGIYGMGLEYGPSTRYDTNNDNIRFQNGWAFVRKDHPLLEGLLTAYPGIIIVEPGTPASKVWVCPEDDREFTSRKGYDVHMGMHKKADARQALLEG